MEIKKVDINDLYFDIERHNNRIEVLIEYDKEPEYECDTRYDFDSDLFKSKFFRVGDEKIYLNEWATKEFNDIEEAKKFIELCGILGVYEFHIKHLKK